MKQHVVHDQVAVRYADGIDHVWMAWEPSLRRCERLFGGDPEQEPLGTEELAGLLRRTQYRAHTAAEFTAGLVPPPSASDMHLHLLDALGDCRDVLGVLALRADMDELDDDAYRVGAAALGATRDAFRGARASTALVHAWVADDAVDPTWAEASSAAAPGRIRSLVTWSLVVLGALLLVALLIELLLIAPPA
jgi:hypothetical protein